MYRNNDQHAKAVRGLIDTPEPYGEIPPKLHIGFTGSRHGLSPKQQRGLHEILSKTPGAVFHHGDCKGSDEQAHEIARSIGLSIVIHPPDNPTYRAFCKSDTIRPEDAFLIRNKAIVNCSAFVIATPDSAEEKRRSGTWSTVRFTRKQNKTVELLLP